MKKKLHVVGGSQRPKITTTNLTSNEMEAFNALVETAKATGTVEEGRVLNASLMRVQWKGEDWACFCLEEQSLLHDDRVGVVPIALFRPVTHQMIAEMMDADGDPFVPAEAEEGE